jgi:hypothetical protein
MPKPRVDPNKNVAAPTPAAGFLKCPTRRFKPEPTPNASAWNDLDFVPSVIVTMTMTVAVTVAVTVTVTVATSAALVCITIGIIVLIIVTPIGLHRPTLSHIRIIVLAALGYLMDNE